MSEYVSDVLGEENHFVCCRCSKKHDAEKHGEEKVKITLVHYSNRRIICQK